MGLNDAPIFEGLREEEVRAITHCFQARSAQYRAGETICSFGGTKREVGILQKGRAVIQRIGVDGGRSVLEFLGENDVFGEELAFSGAAGDSVDVIASGECQVLFIDYDHIVRQCTKACEKHSTLVRNMMNLLAWKALRLSERVEVLSHRSIRGKLLCCFKLLSLQEKSACVTLPYTLSGLAEYIAADRSAMMRELKRMREEGLIGMEGRTVTLLSLSDS